jgi:hypothetical protein
MKKILFILVALMAVSSCTNSASINTGNNEQIPTKDTTSLIAVVTDSIFSQFPDNIDNRAIRTDILKAAAKYALSFVGKPLPIVEGMLLEFWDSGVTYNRYYAQFRSDSPDEIYQFTVYASLPKDIVYKLDDSKKYVIKGGKLDSMMPAEMDAHTKYLNWGGFIILNPTVYEVSDTGELTQL